MADNYLEKRMEDLRAGRLSPHRRNPASLRPDAPCVALRGVSATLMEEAVRKARSEGMRVAFTLPDAAEGTRIAQAHGARYYPPSAEPRMAADLQTRWGNVEWREVNGQSEQNNTTQPPTMHTREEKIEALGRVIDTLDILRVKCPWDAKQTNESLRPNTIEEVYELCDALMEPTDDANVRKELGDVLLHILFYAKIGEEKGKFDIADVADALNSKLIFRHPHVFGDTKVGSTDEVLQNWEELKLKEKGGNKTVLSGVPSALPALIKADRIQEKAANVGFDWDTPDQVWDKVAEELGEVREALAGGNADEIEAEMGDLLFSVVNAARLYKVNPENALERTNRKFIKRFNYLEAAAKAQGRTLKEMTLGEMDALWEEAKRL